MNNGITAVFNSTLAVLGCICGFLYGELDGFLIAVLCLMAMDYITGVVAAFVTKAVNSKTSWRGIIKKFIMLLVLSMAHILDVYVLKTGTGGAAMMTLVEFLFISNEGLSIIENAGKLGIKLPDALQKALVQLKLTGYSTTSESENSDVDKNNTKSDEKHVNTHADDD